MPQSGSEQTSRKARGQRLYLIRLACGDGVKNPMFIDDFVALVERTTGHRYDPAAISRSENGKRDITVDDAIRFAAVDPKQRGKAWLAFGDDEPLAVVEVPPPIAEVLANHRQAATQGASGRPAGGRAKGQR